ncbi:hypothetical protein MRBLMC3_000137 [Sphingobium sp. LMC3-1-1.1]|uniref:hypothetical protein n=1 Tax=Sphingobium sp. LMC3-1-1.1 TaxID=3135241 RepID=UPI0034296BA5
MTSLDTFSGQFKIYDNAVDVTTGNGAIYEVAFQEGCTVTIDSTTGAYGVTAVEDDNANATFRAYYNGYDIYKTFTIAKARETDGTSKYVELATSHFFYAYDANNAPLPQTTTLTLTKFNLSSTTQWRLKRVDNTVVAEGTASALLTAGKISSSANANSIAIDAPLFDDLCRSNGVSALVVEAVVPNGSEFSTDRVTLYQMLQRSRIAWDSVTDPNGTKPEDNATVGAPEGTFVGARPVSEVLADLEFNADSMLEQTFRVDNMETVYDARTFVEGQAVGTFVLNERTQRETDIAAINTTLNLIGAKSSDGTAFVLDAATVQSQPGKTLASTLEEIGAANSEHEASIINLNEILLSSDGVTAKSVLQTNVDGHITGTVNTNDGTVGEFAIVADVLRLIDPNDGTPIQPFIYADGVIKMTNVEVDTLKVGTGGTVGAPSFSSATSAVAGTGTSNWHTILSQSITLASAGSIFAQTSVGQGFPDGDKTWNLRLRINGQNVFAIGGEKTADSVSMSGGASLAAGTYSVEVQFAAETSVTANSRTLFSLPIY